MLADEELSRYVTENDLTKIDTNFKKPKMDVQQRPTTKFKAPGTSMAKDQESRLATAFRPGTGFRPNTGFRLGTGFRPGTNNGFRPGTNSGFRPPTGGFRPGTGMRPGTGFRPITGAAEDLVRPITGYGDGMNRPMTAVRGVGFTSQKRSDLMSSAGSFDKNSILEESQEKKFKNMETNIMNLVVESILKNSQGNRQESLDLAKEASMKEKNFIKLQEQAGQADNHNMDLTFTVMFNLANQYTNNELYTEAMKTYQLLTKNKMFPNSNRLKVNMGLIYFKLGHNQKAIKMFKMALDQVPNTQKQLRMKIMHNIGQLLVKLGKFEEACVNFEYIMTELPDFKTGLDLLLCYYALNDKDKMKRALALILDIQLDYLNDEDKIIISEMKDLNPNSNEVIENDKLSLYEKQLKLEGEAVILTAAKLIAPVIEETPAQGYDWCIEAIKVSAYSTLAGNLEINKAIMFMKNREIQLAIDCLKGFEKQENKVAGAAAANLAFIYYLQNDLVNAKKYANLAVQSPDYHGYGLINLGCIEYAKGNKERAKQHFLKASEMDESSTAAYYNLGILHKHENEIELSLEYFSQVNQSAPLIPWVLFQTGQVLNINNEPDAAMELLNEAFGVCPGAPALLTSLGDIHEKLHDSQMAYNYYSEAFRYYPSDFKVINWLGSYFISLHVAEKALYYFERAALLEPNEPKWRMMVASCYRQSGNLHRAMKIYEEVHLEFPDNDDCLRFLIKICNELGLQRESQEYAAKLKRIEKSKEVRERIGSSRPGTSRPGTNSSKRSGSSVSSRGGSGVNQPDRSTMSGGAQLSRLASSQSLTRGFSSKIETVNEDSDNVVFSQSFDVNYSDPLGPIESRPRTSAGKPLDDEFKDETFGVDLLPE